MKKLKLIVLCFGLGWGCHSAFAATNYVVSGANFQAAIDASGPGDTIVVQATTYPDNVVFNNPVTVLCSGTNSIQFLGTVQIQGTGPMNFAQCQFLNSTPMVIQGSGAASFAQCTFSSSLQILRAGTASFSQCQITGPVTSTNANLLLSRSTIATLLTANLSVGGGTNLQAYDTYFGANVTGGKTVAKRCLMYALNLSGNAAFEGLRVTNIYYSTMTAATNSGTPFVAVQCDFTYPLTISGYKVWLAYNYFHSASGLLLTNCDSVLVGNNLVDITFYSSPVYLVYVQGGTFKAYNNLVGYSNNNVGNQTLYGIWLGSTGAEIVNNTITLSLGNSLSSRGVYVTGGSSLTFRNNIVYTSSTPFESVGSIANIAYCDIYPGEDATGAIFANCTNVPPQFTASYTLNPGSPCLNAGPSDAIYKNRDGTRNDMGWTGGPMGYNPSNYTNNNPLVFFLSGSPQTVFKGAQTNILINAAASAGH